MRRSPHSSRDGGAWFRGWMNPESFNGLKQSSVAGVYTSPPAWKAINIFLLLTMTTIKMFTDFTSACQGLVHSVHNCDKRLMATGLCATVAAGAAVWWYLGDQLVESSNRLEQALESNVIELAGELVEDGYLEPVIENVELAEAMEVFGDEEYSPAERVFICETMGWDLEKGCAKEVGTIAGCVKLDTTKIEEKRHRRVRSGCRGSYQRQIVAACKVRFGTAKNTEAQRRAVRNYATQEMCKHGVRDDEQQRLLPLVVTATLTPDKHEVSAEASFNSGFGVVRRATMSLLKAVSGHTTF